MTNSSTVGCKKVSYLIHHCAVLPVQSFLAWTWCHLLHQLESQPAIADGKKNKFNAKHESMKHEKLSKKLQERLKHVLLLLVFFENKILLDWWTSNFYWKKKTQHNLSTKRSSVLKFRLDGITQDLGWFLLLVIIHCSWLVLRSSIRPGQETH